MWISFKILKIVNSKYKPEKPENSANPDIPAGGGRRVT